MVNNRYRDVDGSPGTNWEQDGQGSVFNQLEFHFSREFTFFFLQFWPAGESHSRGCWRQGGRRRSSGWDWVGARIEARIGARIGARVGVWARIGATGGVWARVRGENLKSLVYDGNNCVPFACFFGNLHFLELILGHFFNKPSSLWWIYSRVKPSIQKNQLDQKWWRLIPLIMHRTCQT